MSLHQVGMCTYRLVMIFFSRKLRRMLCHRSVCRDGSLLSSPLARPRAVPDTCERTERGFRTCEKGAICFRCCGVQYRGVRRAFSGVARDRNITELLRLCDAFYFFYFFAFSTRRFIFSWHSWKCIVGEMYAGLDVDPSKTKKQNRDEIFLGTTGGPDDAEQAPAADR